MENRNLVNDYLQNNDKVKDFLELLEKFMNEINLVNNKNNDNTLLHAAVLKKDLKTVTIILDIINKMNNETKSKYINAQNKRGDTALHIAANLCQKTSIDSDENKKCEAMAKLLDSNGADKSLANHGGEIVGVSDIDVNSSPLSEYKSKILNIAGGLLKMENNNSYLSRLVGSNSGQLNMNNMTTEVSIDNLQTSKKLLQNMNNMATEVSVDQSAGSSSSSVSTFTENSNSSSSKNSNSSSTNSSESGYKQSGGGGGGGNNMLSDTSTFVKTLLNQFNSKNKMSGGNMIGGGGNNKITGFRNLPSLSDYALTDSASELYGGKEFGLSREQMKESSNIHDQVVQIFIDSGKSEEEARIMKMALYKYTKDHHPDLNNLDRARQMKEYSENKSIIKKLDLDSSRKIYEENKKAKSQMSSESKMSSDKSTTEMTEKKSSEEESEAESEEDIESSDKPKKKTTKKATKKSTKK